MARPITVESVNDVVMKNPIADKYDGGREPSYKWKIELSWKQIKAVFNFLFKRRKR